MVYRAVTELSDAVTSHFQQLQQAACQRTDSAASLRVHKEHLASLKSTWMLNEVKDNFLEGELCSTHQPAAEHMCYGNST